MPRARIVSALVFLSAAGSCSKETKVDASTTNNTVVQRRSEVIGPEGSAITLDDGAQLTVPAGALTSATSLTLGHARPDEAPAFPAGVAPASRTYTLEPHGQTFARPVTLRLPVEERPAEVRRLVTAPPAGPWEAYVHARFQPGFAGVDTTHFSYFAVVEGTAPLPNGDAGLAPDGGSAGSASVGGAGGVSGAGGTGPAGAAGGGIDADAAFRDGAGGTLGGAGGSGGSAGTTVDAGTAAAAGAGGSAAADSGRDAAGPVCGRADILVVVENTASAAPDFVGIGDHVNRVLDAIVLAGVDWRLVLLSSRSHQSFGVCVLDPLAGGVTCPANDAPPLFTHLDVAVGESNALDVVISSFASYQSVLRADAQKHIVVSSDGDASMSAPAFESSLLGLGAGTFGGYALHAVVPATLCGLADATGTVYAQLASQTSGTLRDLCSQTVGIDLGVIGAAIATSAACNG